MKTIRINRKFRDIGGGSVGFSVPSILFKTGILKTKEVYSITIEVANAK